VALACCLLLTPDIVVDHMSDTEIATLALSNMAIRTIANIIATGTSSEACGFLVGAIAGSGAWIDHAWPTENIYDSRDAFAISPREFEAARERAKPSLRVVGIYHTHHGPARASCLDLACIRRVPLMSLIIGNTGTVNKPILDWKCFRLSRGKIRNVSVDL